MGGRKWDNRAGNWRSVSKKEGERRGYGKKVAGYAVGQRRRIQGLKVGE